MITDADNARPSGSNAIKSRTLSRLNDVDVDHGRVGHRSPGVARSGNRFLHNADEFTDPREVTLLGCAIDIVGGEVGNPERIIFILPAFQHRHADDVRGKLDLSRHGFEVTFGAAMVVVGVLDLHRATGGNTILTVTGTAAPSGVGAIAPRFHVHQRFHEVRIDAN
jgi:hypothetical protein